MIFYNKKCFLCGSSILRQVGSKNFYICSLQGLDHYQAIMNNDQQSICVEKAKIYQGSISKCLLIEQHYPSDLFPGIFHIYIRHEEYDFYKSTSTFVHESTTPMFNFFSEDAEKILRRARSLIIFN